MACRYDPEVTTNDAPAAAAGTWQLGQFTVNRLGFGAMRVTGTAAFDLGEPRSRSSSIAVLQRAVELGVNHIDTASFYFSRLRSANELINTALSPYRDGLVIGTKVGPGRLPSGDWLDWATPDQLRGQVEENLRQLGLDRLDLVTLRVYGKGSIGEHYEALAGMREEGLIGELGVSTVTLEQLAEARTIAPVVSVQARFGLGNTTPESEALRAECTRLGIAFVPYFAIAGEGRERGAVAGESPEVETVSRRLGLSPAQVRLAWSLHRAPNVLAIPGTGDVGHLEENVAAAGVRLSEGDLETLNHRGGTKEPGAVER